MAAAVADYSVASSCRRENKKSRGKTYNLNLNKTKDILKVIGARKNNNQLLVGFALETTMKRECIKKLKTKNADLIVLNSLSDQQAGFEKDTNKVTIFDKQEMNLLMKQKVKDLWQKILLK